MGTRAAILAMLVVVSTAGCSMDARRNTRAERTDSAGVTIVMNHGDGEWGSSPWSVSEELTFGGEAANEMSVLGRIADLDVDDAGRIYVLDQAARQIRVFDAEGEFQRNIGGPGEGPGEFGRFPNSVLIVADTLLVTDWSLARITRFDLNGAVVRTEPLPTAGGTRSWWQRSGDQVFGRELRRVTDENGDWRGVDILMRLNHADPRLDTLITFTYAEADLGGPGRMRVPLIVNSPAWAPLADGGFAWTTLASRELRIHDAAGALLRIVRRAAWVAQPVDDAIHDVMTQKLRDKMTVLGASPDIVSTMDIVRPATLPVLTALVQGPDSTLWAQRTAPPDAFDAMSLNAPESPHGFGGPSWDVFALDGEFLGTVTLPVTVRIARIRGDRIYGVQRDSLDVERITRLRLRRR
jgi:hypothetical protein